MAPARLWLLTDFGQLQLAWEGALAAYLGWVVLLWYRPAPSAQQSGTWSFEALTLLIAQSLVFSLYGLLQATAGWHGKAFLVALGAWAGGWWVAYWVLRWTRCRGDRLLLPLACLLSGLGWVLQVRLGAELALRQVLWTLFGLGVMLLISSTLRDLRLLQKWRLPMIGSCLVLQGGLLLVGEERNGAALWYSLGPLSFQPIELVKVMVVCLLAGLLAPCLRSGLTRPVLAGLAVGWLTLEALLVIQRDLGMALLFYGVFLAMLYLVSGRIRWVVALACLSGLGAMLGYILFGHVRVRVEAWLDPLAHYRDSGFQISEALFSLAAGGWLGSGLGLGEPWRVPEAHTDFVFVAWSEEMGLLGALLLWGLLTMFLLRTFRCGQRCGEPFEKLLALGLACLLTWQSCIVLLGTLKVMPMTGITLPFISYGGSSLLSNFVVLALLQRMSQYE